MFDRRYIAVLVLPLTLITGCTSSQYVPPTSAQAYGLQDQVRPAYAGNLIPKANTTPTPLIEGGNSLTRGGDPLVSPDQMGGDQLAGSDTLVGASAASTKPRSVKNWYWLTGSIANGLVTINVNGVAIGNYSVTMDKEISDYARKGENQLTISTVPTVPGTPVNCVLSVICAQQPQGSPPLLTYNSQTDSSAVVTDDAAGQTVNGDSPPPASPTALPPIDSLDASGGSVTKTLNFIAE